MQRVKLENKLWHYFNKSGAGTPIAATPVAGTTGSTASAVAATSADEPDGPDVKQQYNELFGMCHTVVSPADTSVRAGSL